MTYAHKRGLTSSALQATIFRRTGDANHQDPLSKFFPQMFAEKVSVTLTEGFCRLVVSRRGEPAQEFTAVEGPAYVEENEAFIKALREDTPPPIDHRDGLMATLMVLQAMASAKSGRPEPIKSVLASQQAEQKTISCQ